MRREGGSTLQRERPTLFARGGGMWLRRSSGSPVVGKVPRGESGRWHRASVAGLQPHGDSFSYSCPSHAKRGQQWVILGLTYGSPEKFPAAADPSQHPQSVQVVFVSQVFGGGW